MILKIDHTTEYEYNEPQRLVVQSHRLYPSESNAQQMIRWQVECEQAEFGAYFYDGAGDRLRTMTVNKPVQKLAIRVSGEVETSNTNGVVELHREIKTPLVYLRDSEHTRSSEQLRDAAAQAISQAGQNQLDQGHAMTDFINGAIRYLPGTTDASYSADRALAQGQGVCQDQTHALITLARINGIPARYVVGYLFTDASGQQHDASHAWAELFIDDLGWVGFDATNACCPDHRYARIGCGIDAEAAALIRGISRGNGSEKMLTSVKISDMQQ